MPNNSIRNDIIESGNTLNIINSGDEEDQDIEYQQEIDYGNILNSIEDINLQDIDGKEKNYSFEYDGETFNAIYTKDNWKIIDSYKINNRKDIEIICQALIDVHPIHGEDMVSYRTVDDLTYEWMQHNIAYSVLPENNKWRKSAKDVDLDPKDQGKTLSEMYESRTGKKFDLKDL